MFISQLRVKQVILCNSHLSHFVMLFWTLNHCTGKRNKANCLWNIQLLVILMCFGLGSLWGLVTDEIRTIHSHSNHTRHKCWNEGAIMAVYVCVHMWHDGKVLSSELEVQTVGWDVDSFVSVCWSETVTSLHTGLTFSFHQSCVALFLECCQLSIFIGTHNNINLTQSHAFVQLRDQLKL